MNAKYYSTEIVTETAAEGGMKMNLASF